MRVENHTVAAPPADVATAAPKLACMRRHHQLCDTPGQGQQLSQKPCTAWHQQASMQCGVVAHTHASNTAASAVAHPSSCRYPSCSPLPVAPSTQNSCALPSGAPAGASCLVEMRNSLWPEPAKSMISTSQWMACSTRSTFGSRRRSPYGASKMRQCGHARGCMHHQHWGGKLARAALGRQAGKGSSRCWGGKVERAAQVGQQEPSPTGGISTGAAGKQARVLLTGQIATCIAAWQTCDRSTNTTLAGTCCESL